METKEGKHSILRPLSNEELQTLTLEIMSFFNPLNYEKICERLEITPLEGTTRPFSLAQLFTYLKNYTGIEAYRYIANIQILINKLVENVFLSPMSRDYKDSSLWNQCYYAIYELTTIQKSNLFWLGKALGLKFLKFKYEPFIVRIEGIYSDGASGTGSGIIINENTIITCGHNIADLQRITCWTGDLELKISEAKSHSKLDIGIIKLEENTDLKGFPYFGPTYILDKTLTLGYPPVKGMREAPLVAQSGEINAISKDWNGCDCITISSITRPGNSGGPVVSQNGYIVGIVTQQANSATSVSVDKENICEDKAMPFYNAIASNDIIRIVSEIDNSIVLVYENYQ